jgi:hypothetical protein
MQCVEQDPYVQIAFLYNLRNNYWANNADDWDDQLGLMNTDWTPKLAYGAYKAYTPGSGGGCTYHEAVAAAPASATTSGASPSTASASTASAPATTSSTTPQRRRTTKLVLRFTAPSNAKSKRTATSAGNTKATLYRLTVAGVVEGARNGKVQLLLARRTQHQWHQSRSVLMRIDGKGNFAKSVAGITAGGWKLRARYLGGTDTKPSSSLWFVFTV